MILVNSRSSAAPDNAVIVSISAFISGVSVFGSDAPLSFMLGNPLLMGICEESVGIAALRRGKTFPGSGQKQLNIHLNTSLTAWKPVHSQWQIISAAMMARSQ